MMKKILEERSLQLNRRAFLSKAATGIGAAALGSLLGYRFFRKGKNGLLEEERGLSVVANLVPEHRGDREE